MPLLTICHSDSIRVLLSGLMLLILSARCDAQTWTDIGGPNCGLITSIAVDPTDANHWLIAAGSGGVFETRDAGGSWEALNDGAPTLATGAVAFAPSNPRIIYVGTGAYEGALALRTGVGILKSMDGGQTWSLLGASTFARGSIKPIRIHPQNPNILLAGTSRGAFGRFLQIGVASPPPFGVQRSVDGGVTWTRTLSGQVSALEIDPRNFNNQYAAIADQAAGYSTDSPSSVPNGIYRSRDGGQTWTAIAGPWGTSTSAKAATGRIEIAVAPSNSNIVYVSIQVPGLETQHTSLLGLYRTDSAWSDTPAWTRIPTSPVSGAMCRSGSADCSYCYDGSTGCGYVHLLSVDPAEPNSLFAGGSHDNLWRCTNCGASPTWTNSVLVGYGDYHTVTWAGDRLIAGGDHKILTTTDRGATWQRLTDGLSICTLVAGTLHPTDPNVIFAGSNDVGGISRHTMNGWDQIRGQQPPGLIGEGEIVLSSSRPETDWMETTALGGISRSKDGGQTWIDAGTGSDLTAAAFYAPVRKCAGNDDVFVTATNRMWRTDAFFSSEVPQWAANEPPSPFSTGGGYASPGTILDVEFADSDTTCNTYVYGNRSGQVRLTKDGGKTWLNLDPKQSLPPRPVNGLAVDPTNANVVYAALSSFDDQTPGHAGHVFKTTNALSAAPAWVDVSPPVNQPFNVIRVHPTNSKLVYAGSDTGLWRSTDGAATWVHDGPQSGLTNAAIFDLKINATTGVTAAFTFGRGVFVMLPASAQPPQITSGPRSPANGATYVAGGLVPGSWAQVQGTNLSTVARTWNDADFVGLGNNLPTKLSGVEVKVNGVAAAVYYVSPTQISFQVPSGILNGAAGTVLVSNPVNVQVFRDGVASNIVSTTGTSSSPGIFPVIVNGKNYPAAVFLDGVLAGDPANGPSFRNARPGDVIQLFATGLFRTQGGIAAQSATYTDVTVTIGDAVVPADAAVLVGPGEFQINFRIPQQFASLPEGDYPISIQYGGPIGTSSPVTINSDPPGPMLFPIRH
jgi:uncharacterized protein (TIGR03437 family)